MESKPLDLEVLESKPLDLEVLESKPLDLEVLESKPLDLEVLESKLFRFGLQENSKSEGLDSKKIPNLKVWTPRNIPLT